MKNCDIYVQSSGFEGFDITIAEARILNKPVVATEFNAVYDQMVNGKNALVVEMSLNGIYEGIKRLVEENELKKIYHLIEN
ncbi:glycosyltransferase [Psychrilyobacter piezotolerans]|uniref:Glycosyltransferase n=1 Tax=Psychrilyobacter piezotolerans TaxID=2293438 RepID=A0ABX9KHR2_9FUSO|nr:glycosyltransferase [Psychrilyobacter piezotolerans]RDE62683.1 glycosyltransferase [Psychrilyobacter sp. S5]REI41613.1 glycosyltransferase [Psychrilyobacter piezotolerans]